MASKLQILLAQKNVVAELDYLVDDLNLYIFPCRQTKQPYTVDGYQQATQNKKVIHKWWDPDRPYSYAGALVGVCPGMSGLVAFDLDVKGGQRGVTAFQELGVNTDGAWIHETPSGGQHVIYSLPRGVVIGNGTGDLPAGIDVRSAKGYIIWPTSWSEYTVLNHPGDWPDLVPNKLLDLVMVENATAPESTRIFLPTVGEIIDQLLAVPEGDRNNTLYQLASDAYKEVLLGRTEKGLVDQHLWESSKDVGLTTQETKSTMRSAWNNANKQIERMKERGYKDAPKRKLHVHPSEYIHVLKEIGYDFKLNVLNDRVLVNGIPITDVIESQIKTDLRGLGYVQVDVARDAFIAYAAENEYHPIREYLSKLTWDGVDYIGALAAHFKDKHGIFGTLLRRWMIGAVAHAHERTQNRMLVLDGEQSLGKSFFAHWICPPSLRKQYFYEGSIEPDSKDVSIRQMTKWIWEVSELGATTRRADREALKAFISREHVTVRVPYGHWDIDKPSLASFIGTINNEGGFLNDPTGHRRFMVCSLEDIDWAYAETIDQDNVWAQAKALYERGERWLLKGAEKETVEEINAEYETPDIVAELCEQRLVVTGNEDDFILSSELAMHFQDFIKGYSTNYIAQLLAPPLTRLGATKTKRADGRGYAGIKYAEVKPRYKINEPRERE